MKNNLKFTLSKWPVITFITIALCFLTQCIAQAIGIELPDQANIGQVRKILANAFADWRYFLTSVYVVSMVLAVMPVLEEGVFRAFLFRFRSKENPAAVVYFRAVASSVLFSAAHYIQQPFPDNAFLALFFFGLAQCWLYVKTGSVKYTILNHALFNLTNLVLLFLLPQS